MQVTLMARNAKVVELVDNFYFKGNLTNEQVRILDTLYKLGKVENLKNIFKHKNVVLHDFQTLDIALCYFNPKFIIGERPGSGKTLIAAGLLEVLRRKGKLDKKVLCVTKSDSLYQFSNEISYFTDLKLLELYGDSKKIKQIVSYNDVDAYDGIVIPHNTIINNYFNVFMSENKHKFNILIFDESSVLKSHKTRTYEVAHQLFKNMERIVMLNGTVFELNIYDFINQLSILDADILPPKYKLERDYCIFGFENGYWSTVNGKRKFNKIWKLKGYKNQEEFREKVHYFYVQHNRKEGPEHTFSLVPVDISEEQKNIINDSNYMFVLNSPNTEYYRFDFNKKNVPKLGSLVDLVKEVIKSKPVIYCYYIDAQNVIKHELEKEGISSIILNGAVDLETRDLIRQNFVETDKYDVLITNVQKAINLPTSDVLIFYTIPSNPAMAYQIMCRIDRNNYLVSKDYFFLCAVNSREGDIILDIVKDREINANLFSGHDRFVFQRIASQIEEIRRKSGYSK